MDSDHVDYIIVGGGCIGASTVHALKTKHPDARIVWYTGDHAYTASNDFVKIIRDAYPEPTVSQYASRALHEWRTNPLFSRHFHHTSWILAANKTSNKTSHTKQTDSPLTVAEMMRLVGSTEEPLLDQSDELYLNPDVGYADSARAVQAVSDKVVELGVSRYEKNVTRLILEDGNCIGVEVADGSRKFGSHTVVSTGAWTPGLLGRSNIQVPSGFEFIVTAVGVAVLRLSKSEYQQVERMPILVCEDGEVILSHLEKALKITTTGVVRIGHPDEIQPLAPVDITSNRKVLAKMLPQFAEREFESFICPDLLTPYQNPIIDHLPGVKNLILATGGSYHSYKFLPIIGNMVVARMLGEESDDAVEQVLMERYRWDRTDGTTPVHPNVVPR